MSISILGVVYHWDTLNKWKDYCGVFKSPNFLNTEPTPELDIALKPRKNVEVNTNTYC